jgi:hypothetical protein
MRIFKNIEVFKNATINLIAANTKVLYLKFSTILAKKTRLYKKRGFVCSDNRTPF